MIQTLEQSTVNIHSRKPDLIQKNISKFRRTGRHAKVQRGFAEPDDSLYEFGGWEEEDEFNARVDRLNKNKKFVDLQCFAWKLESLIAMAKTQLQELEEQSL